MGTELFLLRLFGPGPGVARIHADAQAFCGGAGLGLRRVAAGAELAYLYLQPGATLHEVEALARCFAWAQDTPISRLEQVFDVPGISAGSCVANHYVVETDPEPGWMPEISRWYDQEHMPGLAAVPGCIRASRFVNHGPGRLSLACYDLVNPQTLGSPPWLTVRGTAWSDIARPHFTNTLRTMFDVDV